MTNGGLITPNRVRTRSFTGHGSPFFTTFVSIKSRGGSGGGRKICLEWGRKRGGEEGGVIYQPMAYKLHSCAASSFDFEFVQLLFLRESSFESFYFHVVRRSKR